jgi:hypothetical protein
MSGGTRNKGAPMNLAASTDLHHERRITPGKGSVSSCENKLHERSSHEKASGRPGLPKRHRVADSMVRVRTCSLEWDPNFCS